MKTEDDLVMMIEKVNPAVVSVVVTKDVPIYEQYYEEFNPWGWMGGGISIPRTRENGTEEREVGGGSGFIVSEEGLIVTNRHVVSDDEARYSVLMNDGKTYEVEVLAMIERDKPDTTPTETEFLNSASALPIATTLCPNFSPSESPNDKYDNFVSFGKLLIFRTAISNISSRANTSTS